MEGLTNGVKFPSRYPAVTVLRPLHNQYHWLYQQTPYSLELAYSSDKLGNLDSSLPISLLPVVYEAIAMSATARTIGESADPHSSQPHLTFHQISTALVMWSDALSQGVLPDLELEHLSWPTPKLQKQFASIALDLNLPELTKRHPALIPLLLKSMLDMTIEIDRRLSSMAAEKQKEMLENELSANKDSDTGDQWFSYEDWPEMDNNTSEDISQNAIEYQPTEESITEQYLAQFVNNWEPMIAGITCLDDIYGVDHGNALLPSSAVDNADALNDIPMNQARGCGLYDGIWKHSGWNCLKDIQSKLREMKQLKQVIQQLGKRPSINGMVYRKTPPQIESNSRTSPLGIYHSRFAPFESTGHKQSDSLEGLLISEAILLVNSSIANSLNCQKRRVRKLAFLSKFAEKRLRSYELSGWLEEKALPKPKPWRHYRNTPVTTGGPIVICLDSSWSMSGPRESLAKAVVVECSITAHKMKRECFVMSFSGSGDTKEFEVRLGTMNTRAGLQSLLDFLSHSFHGGTDVISPLYRAIDLINTEAEWSGADVLLITDGELQYPPMDQDSIDQIRRFELEKGLEIHSLLIGRNSSRALELLCTHGDGINRVHDFLFAWDPLLLLERQKQERLALGDDQILVQEHEAELLPTVQDIDNKFSAKRSRTASPTKVLFMGPVHRSCLTSRRHHHHHYHLRCSTSSRYQRNRLSSQSSLFLSQQYDQGSRSSTSGISFSNDITPSGKSASLIELRTILDSSLAAVDEMTSLFNSQNRQSAFNSLLDLDLIRRRRRLLSGLISRLEEGLVERDVEVRLLVLAALCGEHLLLLGPPGTAKSELGRRLARCNIANSEGSEVGDGGVYFERLLTKYTNPEELFGPLSLSALEQDLYIRNIDGYLPTANIAFLDEIFKANSAILNSLLTVLNERLFDNGNQRIKIPLITVVGASNELPDSEELEALYDRFLFRKQVSPVSDRNIDQLLLEVNRSLGQACETSKLPHDIDSGQAILNDELLISIRQQAANVIVPKEVLNIVKEIRIHLRDDVDPSIYISDRRLIKAVNMLKIVAVTEGRTQVTPIDCLLLAHVFWHHPQEQSMISDLIWAKLIPASDLAGLDFLVDKFRTRMIKTLNKIIDDSAFNAIQLSEDSISIQSLGDLDTCENILMEKLAHLYSLLAHCAGDSVAFDERYDQSSVATIPAFLWISEVDKLRLKQKVSNDIRRQQASLKRLLHVVVAYKHLLLSESSLTSPDQLSATVRRLEHIWRIYKRGDDFANLTGSEDGNNRSSFEEEDYDNDSSYSTIAASSSLFTGSDLMLSKKEAQKKFSGEEYKLWKKTVKSNKRSSSSVDDSDD